MNWVTWTVSYNYLWPDLIASTCVDFSDKARFCKTLLASIAIDQN